MDTGNNMRAENWLAAAGAADLLVVTSTVREDTGYSGLWMLDAYQQRTRAVYRVPYDPALVAGSVVPYSQLSRGTKMEWLKACAGMAAAL